MRSSRCRWWPEFARAFYDVLPADWPAMAALVGQPYERDAIGLSFARSRAEIIAQRARSFAAQRIDAMIYPTMPFGAPLAKDPWRPCRP